MPRQPKTPDQRIRKVIRSCKAAGVSKADMLLNAKQNVHTAAKAQKWLPAEAAATWADWQEAIESVYGAS